MSKNSYYLYQLYEQRGDQIPIPCYPPQYSIDANGTMPYVLKVSGDSECNGQPAPTRTDRWVNLPLADDYICSGATKYYKQIHQYSEDSGATWVNYDPEETRIGESAETQSTDCGGDLTMYRWAFSAYTCDGYDKYSVKYKEVSTDAGVTWATVQPLVTRNSLVERNSEDCGYVPPIEPQYRTTSGTPYCSGTSGYDKYVDVYSQVSYDSGSTWQTTATTPTLVEANSEDCGYVPPTPQYRWTNSGTTCSGASGFDKYNLQVKEQSIDSGATWTVVEPVETQLGTLIEANSEDCGYVPPPYSAQYLTFIATESGTFKFSNAVQYSLDRGATWTELEDHTNSPTVSSGQSIMWKATLTPNENFGSGTFSSSGRFTVQGNPMSLLFGDNFVGQTSLRGKNYAFKRLFSGCTLLTSAEYMSLPATTLAVWCYGWMFEQCTSLVKAPILPATKLGEANRCYESMFNGCTSLATAPELPATNLNVAERCYQAMFEDCTSLTTLPQLPATSLTLACYAGMFRGCTSITTIPNGYLPTKIYNSCFLNMFENCVSLVTVPADLLPSLNPQINCYSGMFRGCTSLTTAPELPASVLASYSYREMFKGCTNLNYIKCLATNISANQCTYYWVKGVASSGTFVKNASMSSWTRDNYGIPSGWTVQDA